MKKEANNIFPNKTSIVILLLIILLLGFYIVKMYQRSTSFVKDAQTAEKIALAAFEKKWENVADGCGINCYGCGVKSSRKSNNAYIITIAYECGMKIYDENNHRIIQLTVLSDGKVTGLEDPTSEPRSNEIEIQGTEEITNY